MAVALHERGLFTWTEWAAALAEEMREAPGRGSGETYYHRWLATLEKLVAAKGVATKRRSPATRSLGPRRRPHPHGKPIDLAPGDFA